MAEIIKVQNDILELLYKRDVNSEKIEISPDSFELEEKDAIMRVRELVFNIDQLNQLGLVNVKLPYYESSDSVSIGYLNNAVELYDHRLKISRLGIEYIEVMHASGWNGFNRKLKTSVNSFIIDHPYRLIFLLIIAFILGGILSWLLI